VGGHGNGLRLRLPGAAGQRRDGTLCVYPWHGSASAARGEAIAVAVAPGVVIRTVGRGGDVRHQ